MCRSPSIVPEEDEYALSLLSFCSPYLGTVFPRHRRRYARFLTLRNASPNEVGRWQVAMKAFVQKFAAGTDRVPLLKSPPHTCRIRLLLDLFPAAKFIHVHRHPYAVFQSRRAQAAGDHVGQRLQRCSDADLDEEIIAVYREMHERFFAERGLIPSGCYHELEYEDLARRPSAVLGEAYQSLGLGEFAPVREPLDRYLHSLGEYVRNRHPQLLASMRQRLAREWHDSFASWGYER